MRRAPLSRFRTRRVHSTFVSSAWSSASLKLTEASRLKATSTSLRSRSRIAGSSPRSSRSKFTSTASIFSNRPFAALVSLRRRSNNSDLSICSNRICAL
uniref:Putative secreted protein n=1 Tax=Anopheles darlingi TaxID=43151 RepID=A0A2M4DJ42_ANODA